MSTSLKLFKGVRAGRASQEIVEQVRAAVFDGRLKPGARLPPERELVEQFGVSRITVRDALRVLESSGLVEVRVGAGGGTFVAQPTNRHVVDALSTLLQLEFTTREELVEARTAIEVAAAELAARRANEADLEAMRAAIEDARAQAASGLPSITASVDFHLALARAAHNTVLESALSALRALLRESIARTRSAMPESSVEVIELHERLYRAIAARDPRAARAEMVEHMRRSRERWKRVNAANGES